MNDLDQQLRDTLADDRWAVPVPPDALNRVRRARARRQHRSTALAVTGSAALVGVVVLVAAQLGGAPDRVTQLPGASATANPTPTPLPGSTPGLYLTTGRDWFFDQAATDRFYATWIQPSPGPDAFVASPAPLGPLSAELAEDVLAGGVPTTATLRREDSEGGRVGDTAVQVTLPDGQKVYVNRSQLLAPMNLDGNGGDGSPSGVLEDVPGTSSALVLYPRPPGAAADYPSSVTVVDRLGVATGWFSETVPVSQLRTWAIAAAQHTPS